MCVVLCFFVELGAHELLSPLGLELLGPFRAAPHLSPAGSIPLQLWGPSPAVSPPFLAREAPSDWCQHTRRPSRERLKEGEEEGKAPGLEPLLLLLLQALHRRAGTLNVSER